MNKLQPQSGNEQMGEFVGSPHSLHRLYQTNCKTISFTLSFVLCHGPRCGDAEAYGAKVNMVHITHIMHMMRK